MIFVPHGAPFLAVDKQLGAPLAAWGKALPRPSSILAVSAHWEDPPLTLGATEPRDLVFDFWGFPEELYRVRYPAPAAPGLADRVVALLAGHEVRRSNRGLDHGVWTPLVHLFPAADVPVLQLSMPRPATAAELFAIGTALAPLRDESVLILGSGNLVHNLRRVVWEGEAEPEPWAAAFDGWIGDVLARHDWDALVDYAARSPELRIAHPSEEHFRPVLVAAGAGAASSVSFPFTGWEMGNISRRAVQFG